MTIVRCGRVRAHALAAGACLSALMAAPAFAQQPAPDYRGDMSNTPYFLKNTSEVVKNQNVLTVGWIYAFSSKTP